MKNILVTETDRIGDVILSLPVLKSIKMFDKRIKITALVNSYTEQLFNSFSYVDDIISFVTLQSKNDLQNLYAIIKNRNFDAAIILHPEYTIAKIIIWLEMVSISFFKGFNPTSFQEQAASARI